MIAVFVRLALTGLAAALYWSVVSGVAGAAEPWDADGYWTLAYPGSLVLAMAAGATLGRRGWLAGVTVTAAQLPVMWINKGFGGELWQFALLWLCLLALPAIAASTLAGYLADRRSRGYARSSEGI